MATKAFTARRVLLTQVGATLGLFGTFLLPGVLDRAEAAPGRVPGQPLPLPPPPSGRLPPLVMIDPGHGGRDPGAIGVTGTYEKNVALSAALDLHRLLQNGRRYRVAMTRATDVFIPLEQRVELARQHGADLFVSMHADALPHVPSSNAQVRGASVYTFASHASDPLSAIVAASENASDRAVNHSYRGLSPQVARILASLMRRETRAQSGVLAGDMVAQLGHVTPLLVNPERHAGFVVLQAARIPSILVEMGFMSNLLDETALKRPGHRQAIAAAMHQGIDAYFASHQPMHVT